MGLVHAYKKGEVPASKVSQAVKDAAKSMKKSSVKKYAKTKHDDLPLKKEERDYKDEYKKFQSSTKSKKYRAELNKYNRKKGTYGNGDGKDASHKGGKIVGFEKESVNRGRAEKSRLKKEANMPDFNPMIDKALDEVIEEYTMSRKGVIDKIATLAKANRYGDVDGTKMNGKTAKEIIAIYNHPKMKKFKKAMADYTVDNFVDLTIKLPKVLGIKVEAKVSINKKEMDKLHKGGKVEKDGTEIIFKEEDLMNENPAAIAAAQRMVVQNKMGKKVSVMTAKNASYKEKDSGAHNKAKSIWDRIKARFKKEGMNESIDCLCEACWKGYEKKGMKTMFGKRYPNCVKKTKKEGLGDRMSKVSKKYAKGQKKSKKALKNKKGPYQEGVNENSAEKAKIVKFLIKYGNNPKEVKPWVDKHYKKAKGDRSGATPAQLAQYISFLTANESVNERDNVGMAYKRTLAKVELKKIKDAILMFQKKIKKQGSVTNARDEEHLKNLIKVYKQMGGTGVKESVNEGLDKRQAGETLKQLGGNKFIAMTGAKNFTIGKEGLAFKIGRNAKAVNYVVIQLNGKDLYDMKFQKGTRVLKTANDVYGDQLQKMFTKHTGMYTSLGTMGR